MAETTASFLIGLFTIFYRAIHNATVTGFSLSVAAIEPDAIPWCAIHSAPPTLVIPSSLPHIASTTGVRIEMADATEAGDSIAGAVNSPRT
jgi:hypothetical protein